MLFDVRQLFVESGPSKMPPQLGAAPAQVVVTSFEVVEVEGQCYLQFRLPPDAHDGRMSAERDDGHCQIRHDVADAE